MKFISSTLRAEIMHKLQAITDQLSRDFKGLRKDRNIFLVWVASPVLDEGGSPIDENADGVPDEYQRFDRIIFFANGDFSSYDGVPDENDPILQGNVARVCYMLANEFEQNEMISAYNQKTTERKLARSQHILTVDSSITEQDFPGLGSIPDSLVDAENLDYIYKNNTDEYDWATLDDWSNAGINQKMEMYTVVTGIKFSQDDPTIGGLVIDDGIPGNIHMLLSESIGQFAIQGWYDAEQRWFPEIDPDNNGNLDDSDFLTDGTPAVIDPDDVIGILYPDWYSGASFDTIPGLGRALKFTFTLYDSKGIFKDGKTFTHIVYLN